MKLPLLLLVSLASTATVDAAGFYDVCLPGWKWNFGGWDLLVAATCPDGKGRDRTSWLDMNDCVSNSEGQLAGKQGGRFGYSCQSCAVSGESSISCVCETTYRDRNSTSKTSTLDLNTVIRNVDGILACFNVNGVEVKSLDDAPA